ncbi:MAG: hypothetical protein AAFX99_27705, partial [Myxococcota bacterium]
MPSYDDGAVGRRLIASELNPLTRAFTLHTQLAFTTGGLHIKAGEQVAASGVRVVGVDRHGAIHTAATRGDGSFGVAVPT